MSTYEWNPAALAAAVRGDIANVIAASTSGGIERQEAEGQKAMASRFRTLPKDMDRTAAEAFGFQFGEDDDELFVAVTAPDGWAIRPTDHSMHSDIIDAEGRKRGSIFYKAAFYDRKADGYWLARYGVENDYSANYEPIASKVVDRATGDTLFSAPVPEGDAPSYKRREEADNDASGWLAEHFPNHRDVTAYWG